MTDTASLERRFHELMLRGYRETGVKSTALGNPIGRTGSARWSYATAVCKQPHLYLARPSPQPGFHRQINVGLPELSMEVLVLQDPWRALFTSQERAEAYKRLDAELAHLRRRGDQHNADRLERALAQVSP